MVMVMTRSDNNDSSMVRTVMSIIIMIMIGAVKVKVIKIIILTIRY